MENRFDIILVSWNKLDNLKRTVASLISSGALEACERLIIADNCSTEDGIHEFLEQLRKEWGAFLVLLPHNRGWGQAVNEAIGLSRAPLLIITYTGLQFVSNFHTKMLQTIQANKDIGILGSWQPHTFINGAAENLSFVETDSLSPSAWLLPKSAMEKVGLLPDDGINNNEGNIYVERMVAMGFKVGVPVENLSVYYLD